MPKHDLRFYSKHNNYWQFNGDTFGVSKHYLNLEQFELDFSSLVYFLELKIFRLVISLKKSIKPRYEYVYSFKQIDRLTVKKKVPTKNNNYNIFAKAYLKYVQDFN